MSSLFKYAFFLACFMLLGGCEDIECEGNNDINILFFVDYDPTIPQEMDMLSNTIIDIGSMTCEASTSFNNITLEVLPIWGNTANGNPLIKQSFNCEETLESGHLYCKSEQGRDLDDQLRKNVNRLSQSDNRSKIIEILDVLEIRLSKSTPNHVFIHSNFLEENAPVDESRLRFNFLKQANTINDYSLNSFMAQLDKENSPLLNRLDTFKKNVDMAALDKTRIYLISMESDRIKTTDIWSYSKILNLWKRFFKMAGLENCVFEDLEVIENQSQYVNILNK